MTVVDDQPGARSRRTAEPGTRQRSAAAQRALERRRKRLVREPNAPVRSRDRRDALRATSETVANERDSNLVARLVTSPIKAARRIPFAVVVVGLLLAGLALTLWLSTKSAQDSYQLGVAREQNEQLSDRLNALVKTYESGDSAPELSDKAGRLGMIPVTDVPRLVVGTDGRSTVVGDITPADGPKAPSLNDTPRSTSSANSDPSRTSPAPTPGQQGTPVQQGTPIQQGAPVEQGAPVNGAPPEESTSGPLPAQPQTPANPATTPGFTNVLPPTGGAPGSNSGQTR
ncbi:hypothetical protein [Williamsia sp. D3]|uniref:hypothetical protein n=1 Tax=Williamsia sp. D3 TaxID=1313067 RepID=UPI0003D39C0D|nr:hypothetical protein [Williamsia sp. D3]ETD34703.1 hypothetical protein W823_00010 [Williamsia sp. D3]